MLSQLAKFPTLCRMMESCNQIRPARPIELFGLSFPNPVGLAAGLDKNAEFWQAAGALGFGFAEIGTVTHLAQPGNEKPRLFRYPPDQAIINRMGFNNDGAQAVAKRLAQHRKKERRYPLGINIGKSKAVDLANALDDYLQSFRLLADHADYFTVNVSSPNTPSLRELQEKDKLEELLRTLQEENRKRAQNMGVPTIPILLKIAPDLSFPQIDDIIAVCQSQEISGLIATNTTLSRPQHLRNAEAGGLSGKPVHSLAVEVVKYIVKSTKGQLPVIGVGGIDDARSAGDFFDVGASLVQIYSGLVYRGPSLPKVVSRGVLAQYQTWI